MSASFDRSIDAYLEEVCEENPVAATSLGFDGYEGRLGEHSAEAYERRRSRRLHWIEEFDSISDDHLSFEEQIDKALLLSTLRGGQIMGEWEGEKRDPTTYLNDGLSGVFGLFLRRPLPEEELIRAAVSRLTEVPRLVEEGKDNLDPTLASDLSIERGLKQCRSGITYLRSILPEEATDDTGRKSLAEAGEVAGAAFEDFAAFLEEMLPSATGQWAIGEDLYSRLLTDKEMLAYGSAEMLERGKAAYWEVSKEMEALSEDHFGSSDWVSVYNQLIEKNHPDDPDHLRTLYEGYSEQARRFLIEHDLVTMPEGEECLVVPAPHFQRPILSVASYQAPPPMKKIKKGFFFVPYPPEGTSPAEVQERMRTTSIDGIPTTSVHEAYPGHHWHLVKMQDNPRKIRMVLRTPFFTEGWALYAERLMREQGFFTEPSQELGHLRARIARAARIVVDTSLHMQVMTPDEAVTFMIEKAGMSASNAKTEVIRYCSWPTQASSYLTGALEIERMREDYMASGKGDLKSFHDAMGTMGGLPIGLAERVLARS